MVDLLKKNNQILDGPNGPFKGTIFLLYDLYFRYLRVSKVICFSLIGAKSSNDNVHANFVHLFNVLHPPISDGFI